MLRNLIKEGGLYTIANLLTKGISLLLIPFYTAYFAPADYGIIDILVVFGAFFNAIFSLQVSQGIGRYVGESKISEEARKKFASAGINFTLICYVIAGIGAYLLTDILIEILSSDVQIPTYIFHLALASILINGVFYLLGVYIRFLRKSKLFSILSVSHAVGNILLTLFFVLVLDYGVSGIFIASITFTPLVIGVQLYQLRHHLILYLGRKELRLLLAFSVPLIPAALAYAILGFTDRIFINEYLNAAELGIYGIGAKFTSVVGLIIAGFSMALNPILYQQHSDKHTQVELSKIFHLYIAFGLIGVLILSAFSMETLQIFTQVEYYGAARIMPLLYYSVFFTGIWMFSPGLNIKKKTKITARIVVISSLLNILLNYLFISQLLLIGTALATLISTALNNVLLFYWAQKYYPIQFSKTRVLVALTFATAAIYFSSYWLGHQEFSTAQLLLFKLLVIIGFTVIILSTGLVSKDYWIRIKRRLT